MPYRRRGYKKRTFKKRRNFRKKAPIARSVANKVYTFKRVFALDNVSVMDMFTNKAYSFTLSQLPNYTEFTSLFDMYRIRSVYIKSFMSRAARDVSAGSLDVTGDPIQPLVYDVIDYDDANALSGLTDYEQYQTMRIRQLTGNKSITRKFYPRVNGGMLNSSASLVGASNLTNKTWIDCGQVNIPYFGWKLGIDGTTEGASGTLVFGKLTIYAYVTIQCKQVR